MERLLHTPDGVRDIYNDECERKLKLQNKLHEVLKGYGYRDIETPTFEFFDVFNKSVGTTPSKDLSVIRAILLSTIPAIRAD